MGRGRGGKSSSGKTKKKGLSCPDGACYLMSSDDDDSPCSDSDCSECAGPSTRRRTKTKSKPKAAKGKSDAKSKTKKKSTKSRRRTRDDSTSCSCSDCMDDCSSDDSYNCPPSRGRKCSTGYCR